MSIPSWPQSLDFFRTPLVIAPSHGQLSGDAGLLPVRQFDERIGLTRASALFRKTRSDPSYIPHFVVTNRAECSTCKPVEMP
jgi:hypothetical protein